MIKYETIAVKVLVKSGSPVHRDRHRCFLHRDIRWQTKKNICIKSSMQSYYSLVLSVTLMFIVYLKQLFLLHAIVIYLFTFRIPL